VFKYNCDKKNTYYTHISKRVDMNKTSNVIPA
jgi:hypothetical protein